jgi:tripartite-type tricarboxylate transporter receptor subunit TctC
VARPDRAQGPAARRRGPRQRRVTKSLKLKETAEQLQNDGVAPAAGTPEQFAATIKKEIGVWKKVAADAGVKQE